MQRVTRAYTSVTAVLLAGLLLALPALAQTGGGSVSWQRFDVDLTIGAYGSVNVLETQAIRFTGTYQEGYRLVPLDRATGVNNVRVAEVIDGRPVPYAAGAGRANTYASSIGRDGLQINWWFTPTTNATRTFTVGYTVAGAIRVYDAGDQLQWRAIYADRSGSIDASTVIVHLPADVDTETLHSAWYGYTANAFTGALPATADGTLVDPRTVRFNTGPLPSGQGAEVRVQFPHGAVAAAAPAWQAQADRADWIQQTVSPIGDFISLLLALAIAAGGGVLLFSIWYTTGRDPGVGAIPRTLDSPPSDVPAPVAGALIHEGATEREAVATLVELADRGILRVADEQNPNLRGSRSDVRLTLLTSSDEPSLRSYERALVDALFGRSAVAAASVLLSDVKQQFQSSIAAIDAQLAEEVTGRGWFTANPDVVRRRWRVIGTVLILLGVVLSIGLGYFLAFAMHIAWLPGLALALLGGGALWMAELMPRRTQPGALEAAKWRAFARHVAQVTRGLKSGVTLPAHYLAYAVAFGSDQAFLHHLESVGSPAPGWYDRGGVMFFPYPWYGGPGTHDRGAIGAPGGVAAPPAPSAQGWSDVLAALLNAASEAMAHGGGSGGWSGGGFGGGGGGGGGSGGFR